MKIKNERNETRENGGYDILRTLRQEGTHTQGLMRAARHTIRSQMWNMPTCIPHIPFQRVGREIARPQATRRAGRR